MREEFIREAFAGQSENRYLARVDGIVDPDQVREFCHQKFNGLDPEDIALRFSGNLPDVWRPQITFKGQGEPFRMEVEFYAPGKEEPVLTGEWSVNLNHKTATMVKVVSQEKGKGYGTNHSYDVLDFLKDHGVEQVSLEAAISSGGYVWAAFGAKRDLRSETLEVLDMAVMPKFEFLKKIDDPALQEKIKSVENILSRLKEDSRAVNELALYEEDFDLIEHGLDEDFIQALYEVGRRRVYDADMAEFTVMGPDTRGYMMECVRDKRPVSIGQFLLADSSWNGYFDLTDPELLPDFARRIGRKSEGDKPSVQLPSNAAGSQMSKKT